MNQQSPCTDIQATLARIEEKIQKIDRTIHPPFWLKLLRWIGRNFFTIVLLVVVIILAYKGWEMYQDILFRIDDIKNMPANAVEAGKDSVETLMDKIKFW